MPSNKNKRKASSKSKTTKKVQQLGVITSHPQRAIYIGFALVLVGLFLLITKSSNSAMFGIAMIAMLSGAVAIFIAKIATPKTD